ncbi:MAG: sialidase family protein [Candidatus Solibacter sp.]|jgi:predicted neuraminidase
MLSPRIKSGFIFSEAPFASCHASTVVELRDGGLMAAWFGGSAEGSHDVTIWASVNCDGVWRPPFEIVSEPDIACYNPVLFYSADGRLWLYYKFGHHPERWTAGRLWSEDDAATWSVKEHLPAGIYGPVRTKPLVLPDGTVVSGTSVESYRAWACWIERSTDHARTWTKAGPITIAAGVQRTAVEGDVPPQVPGSEDWGNTDGIIQPSVVCLGGEWLRLYARSTSQTGRVCIADSLDAGVSWSQARPSDVPNPNSGIDAVSLPDGRVVLIYNHTHSGRSPLNLAVGRDGENFRMFHVLEDQPGEFSYPAMVVASNADLLMTYTWNRKTIRFVRFPLSKIPE